MKDKGSMCITEFWPKKVNKVVAQQMNSDGKTVKVRYSGRENETVYRPGRWRREAIVKEKMSDMLNFSATNSAALLKITERIGKKP